MSSFNIDTGGQDSIYQPQPSDPASGAHGIAETDDTLITDLETTEAGVIDLGGRVLAKAWTAAWAAKKSQLVRGTDGTVAQCTTAGTTGATEPAWPTTPGQTVTDGTVTWLLLSPGQGAYASLVATTGTAGVPIGTGAIGPFNNELLGYTLPTTGKLHLVVVEMALQVVSAMTGGAVGLQVHANGGSYDTGPIVFNAKGGVGYYHFPDNPLDPVTCFDGDRIQLVQVSQLTAGSAILYASIWAT